MKEKYRKEARNFLSEIVIPFVNKIKELDK